MVIHKFPFHGTEELVITGHDIKVIHVGVDPSGFHDVPCLWVEYHPSDSRNLPGSPSEKTFVFVGTGQSPPRWGRHVGSVVCHSAGLVWHVYWIDR